MNMSYSYKLMLLTIITFFNIMYGAGTDEPITITYDPSKLEAAKANVPAYCKKEGEDKVGDFLHELEDFSEGDDNERQFVLFEIIHNLLKKNPTLVNKADGGGQSLLYNAVRFDLEAFAALFIAYDATMPEHQNDNNHPLQASTYAQRTRGQEKARKLVAAYAQAQDKEAFRKQIEQRLTIPGISLFGKTLTPNPKVAKSNITQQSTQDENNKSTNFYTPLIAGAALCGIAITTYAFYNKTKSLDTSSTQSDFNS